MTSVSTIWIELTSILSNLNNFALTWSCGSRQRDTTSSGWKFQLNNLAVEGLKTRHGHFYDTIYLKLNFDNFLFLLPLLVIICSLFSHSTWCSRMGTYICNINVKHSQFACDLLSLINVITWPLLWLLCRICSGIFRKSVHLNQLIALSIDRRGTKAPHSDYSNIAPQTEIDAIYYWQ